MSQFLRDFLPTLLLKYIIVTAAGVVPCDGRETSPCTSLLCRLYLFWLFWIIRIIGSQFENSVPLKPALGWWGGGGGGGGGGKHSVAPLHNC